MAEDHGRRPVTVLAGPHGHPLHPLLVTVPIGAWTASLVFDLVSRVADEAVVYARGALLLLGLGLIGAMAAAVVGVLDFLAVPRTSPAFRTALTHLVLNAVVFGLLGVSFAIRGGETSAEPTGTPLIALSVLALAVLVASGWLGGKLVYRFGVRVADPESGGETDSRASGT